MKIIVAIKQVPERDAPMLMDVAQLVARELPRTPAPEA
jgi:hypothetical protein